jgi:hypothetical protein
VPPAGGFSAINRTAVERQLKLHARCLEIAPVVVGLCGQAFDAEWRRQLDDRRPLQQHYQIASERNVPITG